MSFTETKVNELTDSLRDQLANADKAQNWQINAPDEIRVSQGETISLKYTVAKDGSIKDNIVPQITYGLGLKVDAEGNIIAAENGETTIVLTYENAIKEIKIIVDQKENTGFISGDDYIRVTRKANYVFISDSNEPVTYSIDNKELATIVSSGNECTVYANNKNKNGTVVLSAEYNGMIYTKKIRIISLWQEV